MDTSIKLITFDVTGTLIKFKGDLAQDFVEIGEKYGITTVTHNQVGEASKIQWKLQSESDPHFGSCWKSWWSKFVIGTFERILSDNEPAKINLSKVAEDFMTKFSVGERCTLLPHVVEMLQEIKTHFPTIVLGVITNFDSRSHRILHDTGIRPYFDFVLTSHEAQISKPDPAIFSLALTSASQHGKNGEILPQNAIHIGDNYRLDCLSAADSGWRSIYVGDRKTNDFEERDAIYCTEGLQNIAIMLKRLHFQNI